MFFKLEQRVWLFLNTNTSADFTYKHEQKIVRVNVRGLSPGEQPISSSREMEAVCTSQTEHELSAKMVPHFEDFLAAKGSLIPAEGLPQQVLSLKDHVSTQLRDYSARTVRVMRWRAGQLSGDHDVVLSPGSILTATLQFSNDGTLWKSFLEISGRPEIHQSIRVSEEFRSDIESMVANAQDEPLAHGLFLEAWRQRFRNPRSALTIGITALETGVKELISKLLPSAKWLADNSPSPPVIKILQEYVPTLPALCLFSGKVVAPPDDIMKVLMKAVQMRNLTTHRGIAPTDLHGLEEILLCVRDTIWLLDYYAGSSWALTHIRGHVRSQLPASS